MSDLKDYLDQLTNPDPAQRQDAIDALGKSGDSKAVDALLARLHDDSPDVRRAAILALRRIDDPRAYEPMLMTLADIDNRVRRRTSAWVMSMGRDTRLIAPLVKILADSSNRIAVREFAAMALGNIGDSAAVEPLLNALSDTSPEMRRRIVHSLSIIPDPRAVESLGALLNDDDIPTRKIAAKTLRKIGTQEALNLLEKHGLLDDSKDT